MIREYFENSNELTKLEKERFIKFKENNKDKKCYCYYVTDLSVGAGYDIIATTIKLDNEDDLHNLNNKNMRNITDVDNLLDNF